MVTAFNNHGAVDERLIPRAMTLTFYGIPVVVLGLVFLILGAFRKRRARRISS
jgi:hypothetical protein